MVCSLCVAAWSHWTAPHASVLRLGLSARPASLGVHSGAFMWPETNSKHNSYYTALCLPWHVCNIHLSQSYKVHGVAFVTFCAWRCAAAGRHHDGVPYGRAGAGRRHSCRTPPLAHAIISLFDHHSCKKGSITSHSVPGGALPDTRNVVSHAYHVFFCMALALPSHARRVLPNTHDQRMRVW